MRANFTGFRLCYIACALIISIYSLSSHSFQFFDVFKNFRGNAEQLCHDLLTNSADLGADVVLLDNWKEVPIVRAAITKKARLEVNVSTFILGADDTGKMALASLLYAARNGAKVRLLLDPGFHIKDPAMLNYLVQASENIEIKLYNPPPKRPKSFWGFFTGLHKYGPVLARNLLRLLKLNRRMHDKYWSVDGVVMEIGSNNLGGNNLKHGNKRKELNLQGYNPDAPEVQATRKELDILVHGPVVAAGDKYFKELFYSDLVKDALDIPEIRDVSPIDVLNAAEDLQGYYDKIVKINEDEILRSLPEPIKAQRAGLLYDPLKLKRKYLDEGVVGELYPRIENAEKIVVISSPYLVLTREMRRVFKKLKKNAVPVIIVTNSTLSNDMATSQMAYEYLKKTLVKDLGIFVYEYEGPLKLHSKLIYVDGEYSSIGAYQFTPRAERMNRELNLEFFGEDMANFVLRKISEILAKSQPIEVEACQVNFCGNPAQRFGPALFFIRWFQ